MVKDHKHALAFCIVFLIIAISQAPSLILFIFVDTSSNIKLKLTLTLTNKLKKSTIYLYPIELVIYLYPLTNWFDYIYIYIIHFVQIKHIINKDIFLFLIFIYKSKDKVIRTKIFCKENYKIIIIIRLYCIKTLFLNILGRYSIKTEY